MFTMVSIEMVVASAFVIWIQRKASSSIETGISRARIHNYSILAIPAPKVDSASANVRFACFVGEAHAAVEARPFRARVHDDAICASASGPTAKIHKVESVRFIYFTFSSGKTHLAIYS